MLRFAIASYACDQDIKGGTIVCKCIDVIYFLRLKLSTSYCAPPLLSPSQNRSAVYKGKTEGKTKERHKSRPVPSILHAVKERKRENPSSPPSFASLRV